MDDYCIFTIFTTLETLIVVEMINLIPERGSSLCMNLAFIFLDVFAKAIRSFGCQSSFFFKWHVNAILAITDKKKAILSKELTIQMSGH